MGTNNDKAAAVAKVAKKKDSKKKCEVCGFRSFNASKWCKSLTCGEPFVSKKTQLRRIDPKDAARAVFEMFRGSGEGQSTCLL